MLKPLGLCAVVCVFVAIAQAQQADDTKQQFIDSLSLRAERVIIDQSVPSIVWLTQNSPITYRPSAPLKLTLSLYAAPAPQPAPGGNAPPPAPLAVDAKPVKELGTIEVFARDIGQKPLGASVDFGGVADGNYRVVGNLVEGDTSLARVEDSIWLANGIVTRLPDIQKRLEKIQGHESTKATVLYPFDYARVINTGRRAYTDGRDLGIDESSKPNFLNFTEQLKISTDLLAALESGKDPLWQAKGDQKRNYVMAQTGEIMPYRQYVPSTWDGKTPLPLIFILHGNTRNQDFYFDRDSRIIPNHAEKNGYMIVATFGYHPNGGYNVGALRGGGGGRGGNAAFGPAQAGGRGGRGGGFMNGMPTSRLGELSEADTMNVYELIHKEYPIDAKRTFLFGYSAGGNGGYYIAQKYPQNWAAIALGGANTGPNNFPFDKVKHIPFQIFFGDQDSAGVQSGSRAMVEAMKQQGMDARLVELQGFNHDTAVAGGTPSAFEFFNAHPRK